jgi:hypothetical protein
MQRVQVLLGQAAARDPAALGDVAGGVPLGEGQDHGPVAGGGLGGLGLAGELEVPVIGVLTAALVQQEPGRDRDQDHQRRPEGPAQRAGLAAAAAAVGSGGRRAARRLAHRCSCRATSAALRATWSR